MSPEKPEKAPRFKKQNLASEERDNLVEDTKEKLLRLNAMLQDFEQEKTELLDLFGQIEADLIGLKQLYPKDADVKILWMMYEEIKVDIEKNGTLFMESFSESFTAAVKLMQREIRKKGVKRESVEKTALEGTIQQLAELGIHPAYVVRPEPPSDRTIILYAQYHPYPYYNAEEEHDLVKASQAQVEKEVTALVEAGLVKTVYNEGLPQGVDYDEAKFRAVGNHEMLADHGPFRVEKGLGNAVDSIGTEDMQIFNTRFSREPYLRGTAENIFIAQNVAEHLKTTDQNMAVLPFGAGHEMPWSGDKTHPLPLSGCLAYYGYNVVVIDTRPH